MEQIYTIPVNEAFDAVKEHGATTCPICTLYHTLEDNELDIILGASMMEPDIRMRTNAEGFCLDHFQKMAGRRNRLSLALMLESHLAAVEELVADGILNSPEKAAKKVGELEHSCYLCNRIEYSLSRMIDTVVYLWNTDPAFQTKLAEQPRFCLPHFRRLTEAGKNRLSKRAFPQYYSGVKSVMDRYLTKLQGDVSWFCKKFDYRYDAEPWYDAKDAIERTIAYLCAQDFPSKEGRKAK